MPNAHSSALTPAVSSSASRGASSARAAAMIAAAALAAVSISACTHSQRGAGSIHIDHPEVFTRERLLNRRLAEQGWLEQQLNKPVDSSFQGLQDVRTFEGVYLKAQAEFDPLAPATAALAATNLATSQAKAETDLAKAKKDLLAAQQDLQHAQPAAAPASANPANPPAAGPAADGNASSPSRSGIFSNTSASPFPSLPDPSTLQTSRAQLTSIEKLRDQAAYRNAVQGLMREQELDDTHDLLGRTLYTLKFDVSVLAGQDSDALADVECTVTIPPNVLDDTGWLHLYESWLEHMQDRIREEALSFQRRVTEHFDGRQTLTDSEWIEVASAAVKTSGERLAQVPELAGFKALANTSQNSVASLVISQRAPHSEDARVDIDSLRRAASLVAASRYLPALSGYMDLEPALQAVNDPLNKSAPYFVPIVKSTAEGCTRFRAKLQDTAGSKTYIYTVEPKELAQNISQVAASEKLLNTVMSLKAALPQAGFKDLSAYAEYIRRSQSLLHGILRKPLAVGYIKDETEFGWIFGPRFTVQSNATPEFGHTAVQHSVQATLVVPAWTPKISISSKARWVRDDGSTVSACQSAESSKPTTFEVDLPGDLSVITRRLFADVRSGFAPKPVILDKDRIGRVSTGSAQLLVRGSDLWRNPEVYIDSQRADEVRVLPDMGGIVASFSSLHLPPGATQSTNAEVRVVTSAGMDVGFVQIVPAEQQDHKAQRFLTLESRSFIGDGKIAFAKDPQSVPAAYNNLRLHITSAADATDGIDIMLDGGKMSDQQRVTWEIPKDAGKTKAWYTSPARVNVQAQIQLQPNGSWLDVSGGPAPLVHFAAESDFAATFAVKSPVDYTADDAIIASVTIPNLDLVTAAFPDFASAWNSHTVRLHLEHDAEKKPFDIVIDGIDRGGARFITSDTFKEGLSEAMKLLANRKGDQAFKVSLVDARGTPLPVTIQKDSASFKVKGE